MVEAYKPIYRGAEVAEVLCTSKNAVYDLLKKRRITFSIDK